VAEGAAACCTTRPAALGGCPGSRGHRLANCPFWRDHADVGHDGRTHWHQRQSGAADNGASTARSSCRPIQPCSGALTPVEVITNEAPMSLITLLFGRRLANREAEGRKIGAFEGVPAMGLDGLGSASYGPEAMLTVLAVTGVNGVAAVQPISWAILTLLLVLFLSYWQTISAYPSNGGCYTVAHENLGENAGLLAAAALMVDYILNVAVGISAGVGALTSAMAGLHA
jgi:hypothetical protein